MNDVELAALTASVNATRASMDAANEQRRRNGYALAYDDWPPDQVPALLALEAELKLRGIVKV